jgi:hypothetical protein
LAADTHAQFKEVIEALRRLTPTERRALGQQSRPRSAESSRCAAGPLAR